MTRRRRNAVTRESRFVMLGGIVLLAALLTFNAAAIFIRQKFQKPLQ